MTHSGYPAHKDTKKFLEIVTATRKLVVYTQSSRNMASFLGFDLQTTQNKQKDSALQLAIVLACGLAAAVWYYFLIRNAHRIFR